MKVYDFNNDHGNVRALILIEASEIHSSGRDITDEELEGAITNSICSLAASQGLTLQFTRVVDIDEQDDGAVMVTFEAAVQPEVKLGQYKDIPVPSVISEEGREQYILKAAADGIEAEVPAMIVDHEIETLYRERAGEALQDTRLNILTDIYHILENSIHEITPDYKKDDLWHHAIETTDAYFSNGASDMTVDNMISSIMNVLSKYGKVTDETGNPDMDLCARIGVFIESRGKERAKLTGESLADQIFETWLRTNNTTRDQWMESARPEAVERTRVNLLLEAVANAEALEITDEEAAAEIAALADEFGISIDEVRTFVSDEAVRYDLRKQKAAQFIRDHAIII